jgi:hypothetical protein
MKMLLVFGALFGGSTLVVFAQTVDPASSVPYAKEGALAVALGALVWALQHLLRYMSEQQKQFTTTLDNIVARDEQHHKDRLQESGQLRDAISDLRDNCRDVQRECSERRTP